MSDNIVPISESVTLPATIQQTNAYKAYTVSDRERGELGLVLQYDDGETELVLYYAYLMRVVAASPEMLYLIYTDCVYTVYGRHLKPLLPLLSNHKIHSLQAFNEQKYPALILGNDEMFIERILMESTAAWWEAFDKREAIRQQEAGE